MAKLGAHVLQGPRDGYGPFCEAKPAVCLLVDQDPLETEQKSGGHTVTVFRADSVYGEAPPGYTNHPDPAALARQWYPALREKWLLNKADYYQCTNEQGGGEGPDVEGNLLHLIAFEREIMRLANLDGLKVCVLNLAGGSPGDIELWKRICMPFIIEAWAGKNVYGRHSYGGGDLVNPNGSVVIGNPSRPFDELGLLRQAGAAGGIVITECGLDAGFGFAGVDRFTAQLTGYERLLRQYPEFIGCCAWTLGNWSEANWQDAIPTLTSYLTANPTPKWTWPATQPPPIDPPPPDPEPTGRVVTTTTANVRRVPSTSGNTPIGAVPAGTEFEMVEETAEWYGVKVWVSKDVANPVDDETPPPTPVFRATAWPTPTLRTTQWFAANPQNYAQFGLPGHDGQDGRALTGEPIKALVAGTVYLAGSSSSSPNYGIQVRIDHGNGHKTTHAHFQQVSVSVGQAVSAGQVIGLADSTGNSTGAHWHGAYKQDGLTYTDPAGNVWPNNLFDPWLILEPLYQDYLNTAGITGYLWAASTVKHPHFNWGFGSTNLNLRQGDNSNSPVLGLVQAGVPFKITGPKTAGGYYPAVALLGDLPPGTQPPPPGNNLIDLRRFKIADPDCWRVVRNQHGQQEDIQDMELGGGVFVRRKNDLAEWHKRDNTFFYLIHDTSPAPGTEGVERVYTLYKLGVPGAPKSRIQQAVGETWTEVGTHTVQFRAKDDCRNLAENSGNATNNSTIIRYERNYTFNGYGQNLTFEEVIWERTGGETQIYGRMNGKSCGWIGWQEAPTSPITEPVEVHFDRGRMTAEPRRYCGW